MGRKSKLKQKQKAIVQDLQEQAKPAPKGDIETMTHLGYGEHNFRRSPEIPQNRIKRQL